MNEGPISYSKAASILRIRRPTTAKMMAVITAAWDSWEVQAVLAKDEKKKWRPELGCMYREQKIKVL